MVEVGKEVDFSYSQEYGGGPWTVIEEQYIEETKESIYTISNGRCVLDNVCPYHLELL